MPAFRPADSSATAIELTLYIPGLRVGPRQPAALLQLLARADRLELDVDGDPAARLFALFGIGPEPGHDLPVAAVTRVADMGVIDRDWWIRADPVYLEARRESLVLHAGIGLRREEAERLVAELNETLALDGWLLKAPVAERWYLKPPAAPAVTTTPLADAVGRNIHPLLPQGADQAGWHSRLNELQILLHTSPVNAEREARGELPANSVWFWGGGRLPRVTAAPWSAVFAVDPVSLGLARLSGTPAKPLPAGGAELLAGLAPGTVLVALEPSGAVLDRICELWLAPLIAAVHHGRIAALTLVSDRGPRFRYRRRHRWRLWRRGRPPAAWQERAA